MTKLKTLKEIDLEKTYDKGNGVVSVKKLKSEAVKRVKELEKTIKSLHLQNIDLLADKAEQKAKVEKVLDYIQEEDLGLKHYIKIKEIFSPKEADLQEKK